MIYQLNKSKKTCETFGAEITSVKYSTNLTVDGWYHFQPIVGAE